MMKYFYTTVLFSGVLFFVSIKIYAQPQTHLKKYQGYPTDMYFWEYLPPGYHDDPEAKFPLIIFFHGINERSKASLSTNYFSELDKVLRYGPPKEIAEQINNNDSVMCFNVNGVNKCFIVISPQLPEPYTSWSINFPERIIQYAIKNLKVDTTSVYLTGISIGGIAAFQYAQNTASPLKFFTEKIAAIAPVSGKADPSKACLLASRDIAVWAFHGQNDIGWQTPVQNVLDLITKLNLCTDPAPDPPGVLTIFPLLGHSGEVWNKTYETDHAYFSPNVYEWFLQNSKGVPYTRNVLPVVSAGNDITLSLPENTVSLTATASDPDGEIVSQFWTKQAGPSATLTGTDQTTLSITDMVEGTYTFRLTVTDDSGASCFDEVAITVERQPFSGSWLTLSTNSAPGKRIELHADARKDNSFQITGIRNGGNNYLELYLKPISGTPLWNNFQVGLTVKWETRYVYIGNYQRDTSSDGWIRFEIPLGDFQHVTSPWTTGGVSNVGLKILPGFGTGNIVFGVDEIRFTGGINPYVWYGDNNEDYASSGKVYTQDSIAFRISGRPYTGGVDAGYAASTQMMKESVQPESTLEGNVVEIFDVNLTRLKTITNQEKQPAGTSLNFREFVPGKGLYLLKITKPSGEIETSRVFFNE